MQRAVVLRVAVAITQIENENLQNLLVFQVWYIWGAQKEFGEALPPNAPRGYGPDSLDKNRTK